jgi:hypothetical protein
MNVLARRIEFAGRRPAIGDRPGTLSYKIDFECSDGQNVFELTFTVTANDVAGALEEGRAALVELATRLLKEAESGNLGHDPGHL